MLRHPNAVTPEDLKKIQQEGFECRLYTYAEINERVAAMPKIDTPKKKLLTPKQRVKQCEQVDKLAKEGNMSKSAACEAIGLTYDYYRRIRSYQKDGPDAKRKFV